MGEMKTHISTLNPKSVTDAQLYGSFDDVSHDWFDGILAVEYRTLSA
jgi:dynein heavy chain